MTTRLDTIAIALVQSFALVAAALSGERWAILPAVASVVALVYVLWVPSSALVDPHPSQRAESYRVSAQRADDATVEVPSPRPAQPRKRVLSVEYTEARDGSALWLEAIVVVAVGAAIAGTLWYAGHRWALVPTGVLAAATAVCVGEYLRCRLVMYTWRDQERERGER